MFNKLKTWLLERLRIKMSLELNRAAKINPAYMTIENISEIFNWRHSVTKFILETGVRRQEFGKRKDNSYYLL